MQERLENLEKVLGHSEVQERVGEIEQILSDIADAACGCQERAYYTIPDKELSYQMTKKYGQAAMEYQSHETNVKEPQNQMSIHCGVIPLRQGDRGKKRREANRSTPSDVAERSKEHKG